MANRLCLVGQIVKLRGDESGQPPDASSHLRYFRRQLENLENRPFLPTGGVPGGGGEGDGDSGASSTD